MAKVVSALELTLRNCAPGQSLTDWLYQELRTAILDGRLPCGARLPASRDFAQQHSLSRGTVVSVFERLQSEGYLVSRVGSGTWVEAAVGRNPVCLRPPKTPAYVRRVIEAYSRPKPLADLTSSKAVRPFQMRDPAVADFPAKIWAELLARRARRFSSWLRTEDDGRGYRPLREAIAHYLSSSRGARCTADQIVIVSGVQQALDLLARVLLKKDDPVWMEDPGYFGAVLAFENVGAKIVPVPMDEHGLSVSAGLERCAEARGVYVTPAHQFPLGMSMSLERRMELLNWASGLGAFIIEDDYDSEYRFEGRPVPALQSLDQAAAVILIGSFTKLLFPSLRLGYVMLPECLADYFVALRYRTDLRSVNLDQVVLCDFITEGHLGRHLRRMRNIYASRLNALMEAGREQLGGVLEVSGIQAGLYTAAFLRNGMTSMKAERQAAAYGVDVTALDRFTIDQSDPRGVLLGFGAFDEATIRKGVVRLAEALDGRLADQNGPGSRDPVACW